MAMAATGDRSYFYASIYAIKSLLRHTPFSLYLVSDLVPEQPYFDPSRVTVSRAVRHSEQLRGFFTKFQALGGAAGDSAANAVILMDVDALFVRPTDGDDVVSALNGAAFALHEQSGIVGTAMTRADFFDYFTAVALPVIDPTAQPEHFPRFRYWNSGVVIASTDAASELVDFALKRFLVDPRRHVVGPHIVADQDYVQYYLGRSDSPDVSDLSVHWNDCRWWDDDFPQPQSRIWHFSDFSKGPGNQTLSAMSQAIDDHAVTAVVVAYQSDQQLRPCLQSLTEAGLSDIVVWDNASTDSTRDIAVECGAKVWASGTNVGYASGANAAVHLANADLVVVSTPDVIVSNEFVQHAVGLLRSQPDIAAVVPDFVDPNGSIIPGVQPGYSARRLLWEIFRPGWTVTTASRWQRMILGVDSIGWTWPLGACFVVRKNVFVTLGGFDERFFVYMEDVDLGRRMAEAGFSLASAPMVVHHGFSAGSDISLERRVGLLINARVDFAKKHWGRWVGLMARLLARRGSWR